MPIENMSDHNEAGVAALRLLAVEMVNAAKSGHPGAPLGLAPVASVLFRETLKVNPLNCTWPDHDRFVLSNGHACAMLYACLHLIGVPFWSLDTLKRFRQMDSPAAGHPESDFPLIEVTTGPLGQGIANAVGLAMAERHLASVFNKDISIVDHRTVVICGDGCMQEGVSSEACTLASHLGLHKLTILFDDNQITIEGRTDLSTSESITRRFEAYGWHTQTVSDGEDAAAVAKALQTAFAVTDRPTLIAVRTVIGRGSLQQDTASVHGAPLTAADLAQLKEKLGFRASDSFEAFSAAGGASGWSQVARGQRLEAEWNERFRRYGELYPEEAAHFTRRMNTSRDATTDPYAEIARDVLSKALVPLSTSPISTRKASNIILNHLKSAVPHLIGGSADLHPSTLTLLSGCPSFTRDSYHGRNIHFGIREHAMAAICNGLAAHGGLIPFCSTFFNFLSYCLPSVTLSALSRFRVLYIFTHDSIGLGEDGPTHQPIEKIAICRATPGLHLFRPADIRETAAAYIAGLSHQCPTVIALSRQNVPFVEGSSVEGALRGAYVVSSSEGRATNGAPALVIVATGSELQHALGAAEALARDTAFGASRINVVSFPCWELFETQPDAYRRAVFPPKSVVVSVEAAASFGWSRYAHASVAIDSFGASAPAERLYEKHGFTPGHVVHVAKTTFASYAATAEGAPHLAFMGRS